MELNERLLAKWLKLSTSIINSRVVNDVSFNESLVCHLLYQNSLCNPDKLMTATELCNTTNMLKSQMNRTLNLLEVKGIITRERSEEDKRQVYIHFNYEKSGPYKIQHEEILKLVDKIIEKLGCEEAEKAADTLDTIAQVADELMKN